MAVRISRPSEWVKLLACRGTAIARAETSGAPADRVVWIDAEAMSRRALRQQLLRTLMPARAVTRSRDGGST